MMVVILKPVLAAYSNIAGCHCHWTPDTLHAPLTSAVTSVSQLCRPWCLSIDAEIDPEFSESTGKPEYCWFGFHIFSISCRIIIIIMWSNIIFSVVCVSFSLSQIQFGGGFVQEEETNR